MYDEPYRNGDGSYLSREAGKIRDFNSTQRIAQNRSITPGDLAITIIASLVVAGTGKVINNYFKKDNKK